MKEVIFIAVLVLAGCASTTGVIPIGKDMYMISREDNGPTASLGAIKATTFKEAIGFCSSQGKAFHIVKESDTPR